MTKKEMTKAELIGEIKKKVRRAKPIPKKLLYKHLARSTKPELERILRKVYLNLAQRVF